MDTDRHHIDTQGKEAPRKPEIILIDTYTDERGSLGVADPVSGHFPFETKRVFWIYDVPEGQKRGAHAHHTCPEILIPLKGRFTARVHDGEKEYEYEMDNPRNGLYIPAMVWCDFSDFSADCLCLCLAPEAYDQEGYINDFEQFLREATRR